MDDDMTDYQKFRVAYDWICQNITYDFEHLGDETYHMMYTAYAGMFDRTCVCAGYASLLYRMLLQSGIDNRIITGYANGGYHAWNLVQIGDLYYNTDSTWDAGSSWEYYGYCLVSADNFTDHVRDEEFDTTEFHVQYPTATRNYFFEEFYEDHEAAVVEMRQKLKDRTSDFTVYVRLPDAPTAEFKDELLAQAVAHTGVPDEGDYLYHHIYKYSADYSYEVMDDIYYVTISVNVVYYSNLQQEIQLTMAIESFMEENIHSGMTDYEKFDAIYSWVCKHVNYGYSGSGGSNGAAYTAMIHRGAAPRGFSTLLYRLLLECGVDCRSIKGTASGGTLHLWNIVCIDGLYYNVDAGWDAYLLSLQEDYGYRLKNEQAFSTHIRDAAYTTDAFYAQYPMAQESYAQEKRFDIALSRMILGNSLEFQFGVPQSAMADWTGAYATIEKYCPDGTIVTKTVQSKYWTTVQVSGADYWAISYDSLAAKEMADQFCVTIYDGSGKAVSNVRNDSVRAYVLRAFASQGTKGKTMMVDMLNYGAAAQEYFNYNTWDLANNGLTAAQLAYGTAATPTTANGQSGGANYNGSRLVLQSRIQMQVSFKNMDTSMYAIYTYVDHNDIRYTVRVNGSQFVKVNSSTYAVELSRLVYADARALVTVRVYKADGTLHAGVTDSIESYIHRSGNSGLYEALMKFADSANNYLH